MIDFLMPWLSMIIRRAQRRCGKLAKRRKGEGLPEQSTQSPYLSQDAYARNQGVQSTQESGAHQMLFSACPVFKPSS